MNTANLQLEGLYVAVAALMSALRQKEMLSEAEIDAALAAAETALATDRSRPAELSPANLEAIAFPLRYLRQANRAAAAGETPSFSELTARVARQRP
ncbi:hypothetical protein GCM10011390_33700 [Aureimonas endophytica]|uniref:Uncharacterized protein n=1 Tax=Aureimonas endophytica TaxID=2027858 RepID=A0A916ZTI2_9HYPH|nr:hypothetical protein [Aureimonas endophytica]GGE11840.1 hypothetical protein GCM10011390_33700 [Aureimonas endophytica]